MLIYNKTKNIDLNIEIECANTFFKRFIGLMFRKNINKPILIKLKNPENKYSSSIHSFFMLKSIDIYFIDKNHVIFEIANLKPWKIHIPKKEAKYVLEVEENSIKKEILSKNDVLLLKSI